MGCRRCSRKDCFENLCLDFKREELYSSCKLGAVVIYLHEQAHKTKFVNSFMEPTR